MKDERGRMKLGSFKALGAAYVIARDASIRGADDIHAALRGVTYVTASAGNHGLSVAAGARVFGADAVVFLAATVPEAFADRLRRQGAHVSSVTGDTYEASMAAAQRAASENGWVLLSDSSWPGYTEIPAQVMEGYLAMAAEARGSAWTRPLGRQPMSSFRPASVAWPRQSPSMPATDGARRRSIIGRGAGGGTGADGRASGLDVRSGQTGRSLAWAGWTARSHPSSLWTHSPARRMFSSPLVRRRRATCLPILAAHGLETTWSGGAGLAALLAMGESRDDSSRSHQKSRVLAFLTEGAEEGTPA